MSKTFIPLEAVHIASPCSTRWSAMKGDNRTRFCQTCEKNVYNLSNMTKHEAEELITEMEGHLCAYYYQRADGTILTQDCPVGLKKLSRAAVFPFKWVAAGAVTLLVTGWAWLRGFNAAPDGSSYGAGVTSVSYHRSTFAEVMQSLDPFSTALGLIWPRKYVTYGAGGPALNTTTITPTPTPGD